MCNTKCSFTDVDEDAESWANTLLDGVRSYIPHKVVTIRLRDKPWYTNSLRRFKRILDRFVKEPNNAIMSIAGQHPDLFAIHICSFAEMLKNVMKKNRFNLIIFLKADSAFVIRY